LYQIEYDECELYVTSEPLGLGGNLYPAMYGKPGPKLLDELLK